MNTHLKKVKYTMKGKDPVDFAMLTVRGNTIRYFILPETLNIDHLVCVPSLCSDARTHAHTTQPPVPHTSHTQLEDTAVKAKPVQSSGGKSGGKGGKGGRKGGKGGKGKGGKR